MTKPLKASHELIVGMKAPDFTVLDENDQGVTLHSLKGKRVVLYFYPKDLTPGCTTEACAFRDLKAEIERRGAVIFGINKDAPELHRKFREKHQLNFSLLSDPSGEMIEAYGAWSKISMFGEWKLAVKRMTVIIDEDGVIRRIWPKVDVKTHADEVLAFLDTLHELKRELPHQMIQLKI